MLAMFVSLSGTAVASIIISSNHQVAAHVIAGAKGPKRDNKNLIAGSVGGSDLHADAVSGAKVQNGSLTGADVKNGSLTGSDLTNGSVGFGKLALPKISFSGQGTDPLDFAPHHTVLALDGVTIGVSCLPDGSLPVLQMWVKSSSAGTLRGSSADGTDGNTASLLVVDKSVTSTYVGFASVMTGTLVGQFIFSSAHRVIAITLDGKAVGSSPGSCDMHGTAVPAPN
jgi:hypothetical protein